MVELNGIEPSTSNLRLQLGYSEPRTHGTRAAGRSKADEMPRVRPAWRRSTGRPMPALQGTRDSTKDSELRSACRSFRRWTPPGGAESLRTPSAWLRRDPESSRCGFACGFDVTALGI